MKQPPRPRRSRFSSAPEASSTPEVFSESSQGFVAPEEAPGEGSFSDTVASSPEAVAFGSPRALFGSGLVGRGEERDRTRCT